MGVAEADHRAVPGVLSGVWVRIERVPQLPSKVHFSGCKNLGYLLLKAQRMAATKTELIVLQKAA